MVSFVKSNASQETYLVDVTPVLSPIVHSFVQHIHDLCKGCARWRQGDTESQRETYWSWVISARSLISDPEGPHGSFEVADRTLT